MGNHGVRPAHVRGRRRHLRPADHRRAARLVGGVPITIASLTVVAALLLAGLVPLRGIAILPIAGILTGGAMTATSLAGRRFNNDLRARRGEVEAALALGLLPRDAVLVYRPVSAYALQCSAAYAAK
ncbi:ABC transporter permease [Micromonospora chersina]|uniref:ABC transporter permease n=1 Tax=Micromonospora chersina TaxID=47854 RepID=UPI003723C875